MGKFLVIENAGLLNEIDITSLGLSSKRGESDKIGQFGSGWKYALAWLVRNNINLKIFSGNNEIKIDTETILHKDSPVSFITVNGRKTDITTGFGEIDWEPWMALRELISNAMDEGEFKLSTMDGPFRDPNKTTINLEMNEEITKIMVNYHHYFCFDRIPSYENMVGKVFIKTEESNMSVYRKGIRCYDSSNKTFIDIDFNHISINESRLTPIFQIDSHMKELLRKPDVPTSVWEAVFKTKYTDWLPIAMPDSAVNAIKDLVPRYNIQCPINVSLVGIIASGILSEAKPLLVIPNKYYDTCVSLGIFKMPEQLEKVGDIAFVELDDDRQKLIEYYLKNFGYPAKVRIGSMDYSKDVLIQNNLILIKKSSTHTALELATLIIQTLPINVALPLFQNYFE